MPVDWSKYGGESTRAERTSAARVDWNKYDPEVIAEQKRQEGIAVRAAAPDLFNLSKQQEAIKKRLAPVPIAPAAPVTPPPQTRREWVVEQNMKDREEAKGKPFQSVLQRVMEPLTTAINAAQAYIPGVTAFQKGAGAALNIETDTAPFSGPAIIDKPAEVAGMLAGAVSNPSNISQNLVTAPYQVGRAINLTKFGRRLTRGRGVAQRAMEGATAGAIQGGVISGVRDETDADQVLKSTMYGAVLGGVGDVAIAGLGKAAQSIIGKYRKPAAAPLQLPAPRQRGNVNKVESIETITPEYQFKLNEPSSSTLKKAENVKQARDELKVIDDEIRQLNSSYERAVVDEFNYLKKSLSEPGGVKDGEMHFDADGNVISRVGWESQNPTWYREFHAAKGKFPSNKELYQLARKRVDEGFKDEFGDTPSWKDQNSFNDSMTALQEVRTQIDGSLKEFDPAVNITDSPLKVSKLRQAGEKLQSQSKKEPIADDVKLKAKADPEAEVEEILQAVNKPRVRDRVYSFLDEQETAARKRIAGRRNRLSANPLDEWADHSIIMAAKLGKGTIKAADFTEELVKEFGESIRPNADKIFRRTKEELRKQERTASKEGKAARAFNEITGGDETTFGKKISRDVKEKKAPFKERVEKLRAQLVDDAAPLEEVEKRITGTVASAEDSLYKAARLFRGVPEKAHQIVETRLKPIIDAVEKAGYTTDDLGMYALAKHAKDVNAADYKSGFTNAEIEAVLKKYKSPEMDAAQQALNQITRDMMQELVDSGVVSRELADVLADRWKNYVPLFRAFDDDKVEFGTGLAKAMANVTSPIKALSGSERKVVDPLENMVKNIFQSTSAAERNKVATQLAKLAEKDIEGEFIRKITDKHYVTVTKEGKPTRIEIDQEAFEKLAALDKDQKRAFAQELSGDPDATFTRVSSVEEAIGRKNVVNVKVNGENVPYEVEPEVYKTITGLDKETSNALIKGLSAPASLLRAGATLTPEFSLRNPMRDIVAAYVNSNSGFNPITDFTAGLVQSISKGPLYREWVKNLGSYGNVLSMDRKLHRKALEKVLKEPPSKKFINIVSGKTLLNVLRYITDTTESATKVGEYRAALRKGATPEEAAFRSRDLMDFARSGSSVRQANKVVAFLNANIQGKSKLYRTFKENPARSSVRAFKAITVPTIAVYAINELLSNDTQKQTISEAPNWMKDTFWLVSVPGTDIVARLPKPFDLAPAFANLPERALDFVRGKDKQAFEGFLQRTVSSGALPTQITALMPMMEGMSGYSFFKEGDIVPQREQGLERKDQYDPVLTTETGKLLAKGAEKLTGGKGAFKNFSSPRVMDNTIRGFTAGLGTYGTDVIDLILKGTGIIDRPASPQKRLEQQPLVRAFAVDPLQAGKSMDTLYRERDELNRQKASNKLNKEPFKENAKLKQLNGISDSISDINSSIREIERNEKLSAREKRLKIEPLMMKRNQLAKDAADKINR